MARPAGLEPATYGFEGRRSIQLSYGRESIQKNAEVRSEIKPLLAWYVKQRFGQTSNRRLHCIPLR